MDPKAPQRGRRARNALIALGGVILGLAASGAVGAAPSPAPARTVSPLFQLATPPSAYSRQFSGTKCLDAQTAQAAAQAVNPITGTISTQAIVLQITKPINVADATARAQLAAACAHGR